MSSIKNLSFTILIVTILLTGCRRPATPSPIPSPVPETPPATDPAPGEVIRSEAVVDTVEILILESFPVQINVVIKGNLPDQCTELDSVNVEPLDNRFNILVLSRRQAGLVCGQALRPFEETVGLEVVGFAAGEYEVVVNGISSQFTLVIDNNPAAEPPPAQAGSGSLSGRVWHDLCGIVGGEGGEPAVPTAGCTAVDGGYQANGALDPDEPGLEGLILNLGSGSCPSVGILTALTNETGTYEFADLLAGTYCVSIDTGNRVNEPILIPGAWTAPVTDQVIVEQMVVIPEAGALTDVNFGWDYQFLPAPEPTAGCTDRASFIEDVTVPDRTIIQASNNFEKTWRLKNTGTCTWGPEYALIFVKGEQLNGPNRFPLEGSIFSGDTVDFTIALRAPDEGGTYQGFWQLMNPTGEGFGFGEAADQAFWVLIAVEEGAQGPGLGQPTWQDSFTEGSNWPLFEDDHGAFIVEAGKLVMRAKNPDWWDSWMLTQQTVADFQLEITAAVGECTGFDHYGLIFRAPDPTEGLLFTVACDGRYALRKWDGAAMTNLIEWTSDKAINSGPSQTNRLRVKAEGGQLTLFINDIELEKVLNESYLEGRFGLFIGAAASENFIVEVDQISLWEIK